ncbi:MAG: malectin domain-containing carbohydrate-binding protein [Acidobacteriota bacterium]|nr:malectin domain-containing carbohydrate-binding protein [Acidobacteriota bacterium]
MTPENSAAPSIEQAEHDELDAVAEALTKSHRLERLLRYLGDKYFQGEVDHLNEYNIATEVFGRSKTTFDAGEDAIARVEAHRLRKKLREFYENEGKDHPVQVSIPAGSYVPVFTHRPNERLADNAAGSSETQEQGAEFPSGLQMESPDYPRKHGTGEIAAWVKEHWWIYPLAAVALAVVALAIYWPRQSGAMAKGNGAATAQPPVSAQPTAAGTESLPIRIMAGYNGKPQIDSAGEVWGPDRYFHNGGMWTLSDTTIARTTDQMLFEHWRTGDFSYDIPLPPGVYELHLYFITEDHADDTTSTFSVAVNGDRLLGGFDVNSDALGVDIADERIFRDVSPSKDGYLHLSFSSERGAPVVNALKILPGIPHKQLPIRLVMQPTSFTDHDGNLWHPDNYFMNGHLSNTRRQIAASPDPDLFAGERYGHFTYSIPADTRDRYTVVLHFAEFYFGPQGVSGDGGTGSRIFNVMCNGATLLDNFDIFKEAGSLHALTKTFYHIKPSPQGKLNLTFEPIANNATVSGIEVLDESQ